MKVANGRALNDPYHPYAHSAETGSPSSPGELAQARVVPQGCGRAAELEGHADVAADHSLLRFRRDHPLPDRDISWDVRRMLQCIHDRLFDAGLNVRKAKACCGIRDNNISCRFKKEMGVSIKNYIETLRMEAARLLLDEATLSVAEIAYCIGYSHLQTFYRVYSRRFRCTPGFARTLDRAADANGVTIVAGPRR